MFTAERIALLLLAIAVVVWATVVYLDNHKGPAVLPEIEVRMDTAATSNDTVNVGVSTKYNPGNRNVKERTKEKKQKSKNRKSGKSRNKAAKQPVKHRDHLREPVQE